VRRRPVEDAIAKGYHVFSLIDLGTAEMARQCWPDCVTIFLMAPLEILEKRLVEKGAHSAEEIEERLENARKAFSKAPYYDYVIPNRQGQLEKTSKHLISIFEKEMREEIT
jgi:guanylate kinase